jgi:sugar phosphate isomerase/epimerase
MFSGVLDHVLEIGDLFGTERILFVGGPGVSTEDLVDMFGWSCDRCAEQGRIATLEFMDEPSLSSVPDAASALRVVQAADRANGGVMVDVYHHISGSNDWNQLESLPGDSVHGIQFDDLAIPRVGKDYLDDTLHYRRAPGEGDADVVRFVRTMDAIGARCPYSVEVISDEIVQLAPKELGERLGSASRRVFEAARS